jgi:PST family polysaccharide transporter
MKDLKERAIRGSVARVSSQIVYFALRVGTLMVLARLLDPKDFGLVGMVAAFTGVLTLFRDFGLSTATVQSVDVTEEQVSTLFWINILVGAILTIGLIVVAPLVAAFYHESRLFWVTIALASGFLLNAAGVQHSALLQREMRFTALAIIQIISLVVSTALGIGAALAGFGYWALVIMTVTLPLVSSVCFWLATAWIPGMPRRRAGIRSMMRFGGAITLVGLIVYIAYNLDKVLLGRFWGAEVLGIYGRSYQIINLPTDNLNSAVGEVAFAALSRIQGDPIRLRNYFLKGHSLVLSLTVPLTLIIAFFSHDLIAVVLGAKWNGAADILRLLAPTILIFALINPIGWLLYSLGMVERSLKVACVLGLLVTAGYILGLPYGAKGVALGLSATMALWAIPHIAWGVHGTVISLRDVLGGLVRPITSGITAAILALAIPFFFGPLLSPFPRLVLEGTVLLATYAGILLYVMGQKGFYMDLLRGLRRSPSAESTDAVSA